MLGSVDPDDVQVAEVHTLLVHQRRAGTALGPARPPGCAGRGLIPPTLSLQAELRSQDSCFWSSVESDEQQRKDHWDIFHSETGSRLRKGKEKETSLAGQRSSAHAEEKRFGSRKAPLATGIAGSFHRAAASPAGRRRGAAAARGRARGLGARRTPGPQARRLARRGCRSASGVERSPPAFYIAPL